MAMASNCYFRSEHEHRLLLAVQVAYSALQQF